MTIWKHRATEDRLSHGGRAVGVDLLVLVCRGDAVEEERNLGRAWSSRPLLSMAEDAVNYLDVEERTLRWSVAPCFRESWDRYAYDCEHWVGPIRVDVMRSLLAAARLLGMEETAADAWRDLLEGLADGDLVLWGRS